jgi:hypothetical protein
VLLALVLVAALLQGRVPFVTLLPGAAGLVLGGLRLRAHWPALMNATRVSRRTTLTLVALFLVALVPGGHGVAPLGLFLVHGWEQYPVGALLAWLALLFLGAGLVARAALAAPLSLLGSALALLAWGLFEARVDEFLAGVVGSLPFLLCLLLHVLHLARVRAGEPATSR